jgi:lipoprotein-anchoring transpeptidase ErfK/SrfK
MPLSRRDFLKISAAALGSGAAMSAFRPSPLLNYGRLLLPEFPEGETLARNCVGGIVNIMSRPDVNSTVVTSVYEDTILPWLREVPAENLDLNRINQNWVETPQGFIYSPNVQPCKNKVNTPLNTMPPAGSDGVEGFWVEVTVPYVDFVLDNLPARSPGLKFQIQQGLPTRLYYKQIMWADEIRISDDGAVYYRVGERFGSYGDLFVADATAFRPLTEEDSSPINPNVDPEEKIVKVNVTDQTLSCFEGKNEVYFCRVSTGVGEHSTPIGESPTWRKMVSTHMAGGTVSAGYDTPGIAWTSLFSGEGVAIHSTFWHNDFGAKRSHGCVNVLPDDAQWIFRWSSPEVPLVPGDQTIPMPGGTHVKVEERFF